MIADTFRWTRITGRRAEYLFRGRRDRISGLGVHFDGTGARAVCHAFGFQYKQRVASMLPMGFTRFRKFLRRARRKIRARKKRLSIAWAARGTRTMREAYCGRTPRDC